MRSVAQASNSFDAAVGAGEPRFMLKRETLELVHAYCRIVDPVIRRRLIDLARALGDGPVPPSA